MFGLVGVARTLSANPCAAGGDPFLGEIDTFPYNFCPVGWAPLNGQRLQFSTNTALFSLLGITDLPRSDRAEVELWELAYRAKQPR
jgi:hypothetical protein